MTFGTKPYKVKFDNYEIKTLKLINDSIYEVDMLELKGELLW